MLVKAAQGAPLGEVETAVQDAVAEFPNVQVQDQAAFREQQAGFVDLGIALWRDVEKFDRGHYLRGVADMGR